MVKSIDTLVADIEQLLIEGVPDVPPQLLEKFGQVMAQTVADQLKNRDRKFTLRMSNIGTPCARKLWLDKNFPEGREPLTPATLLKFIFGNLVEELVILLAELSGHKVEGRQDTLVLHGIEGHRDVVIDGTLTDAKSAASQSFKKFKDHLTPETDSFGYLGQIGGYLEASQDDPIVTNKNESAFLVVDKQHGHLTVDKHPRDNKDWSAFYEERIKIVNGENLPDRHFPPKQDGYKHKVTKQLVPNGNLLLGTNCSYCDQKFNCYDNIRVFLASTGPKYFVHVVKEPKMLEITGKKIDEIEIEPEVVEDDA